MKIRSIVLTVLLALAAASTAFTAGEGAPEFRFSYLPYSDAVRFTLPSSPADASRWRLTVTPVSGGKTIAEKSGNLPLSAAGETVAVPKLAAGDYKVTLNLSGGSKPLTIERTFTRKIYPWEHNGLGKAAVVIPPFTPLAVDKKAGTISCILRKHSMSSTGLWDQVVSEDTPILASPMRLDIVAGGTSLQATGSGFRFAKTQGSQVTGSASWSAGPLNGKTDIDFDYDGMMKITLRIEPTKATVSRIDLIIPMKSSETWLMHPVTDDLRSHYAGRIPEGDGKVWDSVNIHRSGLPAPFVPYIWLGGPERGICWFADNDKDWITDPAKPAMEIRRTKDSVELVIHFVNRAEALTRPRTIVFGIQATPAKPMAETPYNFRKWWYASGKSNKDVNLGFMGACYYWGCTTAFSDFFPANRNYSIYYKLAAARKSGGYDPKFVDTWLEQFTIPPYTKENIDTYRAHVRGGLGTASGSPINTPTTTKYHYVIPYTNARGLSWDEECKTFMDEWSIYDITDPSWDRDVLKRGLRFTREHGDTYGPTYGICYETDPVESYIDRVLYYHQKMYQTFADGIYWDDYFFKPNSNPVPGPAYVGDDGKIHPGVSLFGFRELTKRNAVMQYQMGMPPISFIHMTNVNVVPMLSFGTMQLDWEWHDQGKYASMDLQDRLDCDKDTDLILAMSTGLQTGNISFAVDRFQGTPSAPRDWLIRTVLAVCLIHEIKPQFWEAGATVDILETFGYGEEDCKVYRYWDPVQAVTTTGANVKTLTLSRCNQAMIVVGSFGEGGDCTLNVDLAKLGIPESATATNSETNAGLKQTAPGTFILPIKKHDYQIVVVK